MNYASITSVSDIPQKKSNILILELKGQLFYGNLSFLKSFIEKKTINSSSLNTLIFDIKNLYHIDNSGSESFCQIIKKLNNKKIRVIISGFNKKKKGFKFDKNLINCIKKENIFISTNNALNKLNT